MKLVRFAGAALALLVAAPAAAQPLPPARQVLDRYVEAVGGRAAVLRPQFRHAVYELEVDGTTMRMEVRAARPNRTRVTMSTPVGDIESGYDGQVAWMTSAMTGGALLEGPDAAGAIAKGAFDHDVLFDAYDEFVTIGLETFGGKPCYNVRMSSEVAGEVTRCFSTETGLQVAAREGSRELRYVEYQEVDGLKYASLMTGTAEGQTVTMTLKSLSHAPLPAETFALPEDVRALVP